MKLLMVMVLVLVAGGGPVAQGGEPAPDSQKAAAEAEVKVEIQLLIRQLNSELPTERQEATRKLIEMGSPAISALKDAIANPASVEVKTRATHILNQIDWPKGGAEVDQLQLTLRANHVEWRQGSDVRLQVRLRHTGKQNKELVLVNDGLGPTGFRPVVKNAKGDVFPIGYFCNFNSGPVRVRFSIPAESARQVDLSCFLGRMYGKGGGVKPLPPGKYEVAVVMGDEFSAWKWERSTKACSNWVEIQVR